MHLINETSKHVYCGAYGVSIHAPSHGNALARYTSAASLEPKLREEVAKGYIYILNKRRGELSGFNETWSRGDNSIATGMCFIYYNYRSDMTFLCSVGSVFLPQGRVPITIDSGHYMESKRGIMCLHGPTSQRLRCTFI